MGLFSGIGSVLGGIVSLIPGVGPVVGMAITAAGTAVDVATSGGGGGNGKGEPEWVGHPGSPPGFTGTPYETVMALGSQQQVDYVSSLFATYDAISRYDEAGQLLPADFKIPNPIPVTTSSYHEYQYIKSMENGINYRYKEMLKRNPTSVVSTSVQTKSTELQDALLNLQYSFGRMIEEKETPKEEISPNILLLIFGGLGLGLIAMRS